MSKCERKVVRKFALEMEKLMHSLCPTNRANKQYRFQNHVQIYLNMNFKKITLKMTCSETLNQCNGIQLE